jgi:2-oxoglutarate ferredoxin oxidoreductase subunit beta
MPGLVPGIHAFFFYGQDVDGRDKPDHDGAHTTGERPPSTLIAVPVM